MRELTGIRIRAKPVLDVDPGPPVRTCRLLEGRDRGPARDGAAHRAPATEALVDLRRDRGLLLERTLGLDLRIGDVADGEPGRRALAHVLGDEPEHGVAHL